MVDSLFEGKIASIHLQSGYTGAVTLERDLAISGNVTLAGGTLAAGSRTLAVGGDWTLAGGTFEAGTSTVIFNDANQVSRVRGNNTFFNFHSQTPSKGIAFQAGSLQTILGTLNGVGRGNFGGAVGQAQRSAGRGVRGCVVQVRPRRRNDPQ